MEIKKRMGINVLWLLVLLFLIPLLFSRGSLVARKKDAKVTVIYFYENACGSCNPEQEFIELFNQLVGEERKGIELDLLMYNTFHDRGSKLIREYFKEYDVPKAKQSNTMVFIGDSYLSGQSEIESRLKGEFLEVISSIAQNSSKDSLNEISSKEKSNQGMLLKAPSLKKGMELETQIIQYFHVTACSSCLEVEKFLDTIQNKNIKINEYNISQPENLDLVKQYFDAYRVSEEDQSVPIIFIGDTYLSGEKTIKESLVNAIDEGQGIGTPIIIDSTTSNSSKDRFSGYGIVGVILTGLINGLNPCSISMLLFFLSMLTIKSVSALKMGLSFIAGKFITYFFLGTLLFNAFIKLDIPWFQTAIKGLMILLLLLIAFLNIGDFIAARKEEYNKIRMQLPVFLRRKNHQWIKKFSSIENPKFLLPISFGLGGLISVGEFLCTGQIYLATIISVLHDSKYLDIRAIIYFLLYGVAFVLPLILITIVIHKGREIFDLTEWMRDRMPIIKLINAIVFIIFSILIWIWF